MNPSNTNAYIPGDNSAGNYSPFSGANPVTGLLPTTTAIPRNLSPTQAAQLFQQIAQAAAQVRSNPFLGGNPNFLRAGIGVHNGVPATVSAPQLASVQPPDLSQISGQVDPWTHAATTLPNAPVIPQHPQRGTGVSSGGGSRGVGARTQDWSYIPPNLRADVGANYFDPSQLTGVNATGIATPQNPASQAVDMAGLQSRVPALDLGNTGGAMQYAGANPGFFAQLLNGLGSLWGNSGMGNAMTGRA